MHGLHFSQHAICVPFRVCESYLRMFFSDYGKEVRVTIPMNVFNQSPLGHACLQFDTANDVLEALLKIERSLLVGKSELSS